MKSTAELKPVYRRVFQNRDGEIVLDDLLERFYHNKIKDETMARQVGQRDVLMYLKRMLTEDRHA